MPGHHRGEKPPPEQVDAGTLRPTSWTPDGCFEDGCVLFRGQQRLSIERGNREVILVCNESGVVVWSKSMSNLFSKHSYTVIRRYKCNHSRRSFAFEEVRKDQEPKVLEFYLEDVDALDRAFAFYIARLCAKVAEKKSQDLPETKVKGTRSKRPPSDTALGSKILEAAHSGSPPRAHGGSQLPRVPNRSPNRSPSPRSSALHPLDLPDQRGKRASPSASPSGDRPAGDNVSLQSPETALSEDEGVSLFPPSAAKRGGILPPISKVTDQTPLRVKDPVRQHRRSSVDQLLAQRISAQALMSKGILKADPIQEEVEVTPPAHAHKQDSPLNTD